MSGRLDLNGLRGKLDEIDNGILDLLDTLTFNHIVVLKQMLRHIELYYQKVERFYL